MNEEFVKCDYCKMAMPTEACKLAAYRTVIDGKEYLFCCQSCAQKYVKKQKKR